MAAIALTPSPPAPRVAMASSRFPLLTGLIPKRTSPRRTLAIPSPGTLKPTIAQARDPFPAEVESNFADKVMGNASTEHVILIPPLSTGLAQRSCQPLPSGASPLSESQARSMLRKIVGWRILNINGALRLQCEWKLKNFLAGLELFRRIAVVAEVEGHHPDLHLEQWNRARAEIWSHSVGGLSENDFILAAKIDGVNTSDLVSKKNKVWA